MACVVCSDGCTRCAPPALTLDEFAAIRAATTGETVEAARAALAPRDRSAPRIHPAAPLRTVGDEG